MRKMPKIPPVTQKTKRFNRPDLFRQISSVTQKRAFVTQKRHSFPKIFLENFLTLL
jgi:hypothetical protein